MSFDQGYEFDPSQNPNRQLHVCTDCGGNLVQPVLWEQTAKGGSWRIYLRCPECEHKEDGVFDQATIDRFNEELNRGKEKVAEQLRDLQRENMQHEAGIFTTAIETDLISADDFQPHRQY